MNWIQLAQDEHNYRLLNKTLLSFQTLLLWVELKHRLSVVHEHCIDCCISSSVNYGHCGSATALLQFMYVH